MELFNDFSCHIIAHWQFCLMITTQRYLRQISLGGSIQFLQEYGLIKQWYVQDHKQKQK